MYLKYSLGFLIASVVQFGIIYVAELLGLSTLGAKFSLREITIHIIVGQIGGFLLLFIIRRFENMANASYWSMGTIYGIIVWAILMPVQVYVGTVSAPWNEGIMSLLVSLIAFALYGIIAAYTIKHYGIEKSKYK